MNSVCIINMGCKVNQYESDAIANELTNNGFSVNTAICYSDYYVINTCAVTSEAEKKSRQVVSKALKQNPNAKIYLLGCASQNSVQQFKKHLNNIEYINGNANKMDVIKHIVNHSNEKKLSIDELSNVYEEYSALGSNRTRAYIKIQDGCNNFCSYCLIPYVRGRSRSRNIDDIVNECSITQNITNELVLTGINISAYGKDIGVDLATLLYSLKSIEKQIRLGSLEVNVIDEKLLDSTKKLQFFCPQFHLSLQSACDKTLRNMNRKYTFDEYKKKVELIREYYPDAGITTDIIVGFPTETDDDFNQSLSNIKQLKLSSAHVFPYSPRRGTMAYKLPQINGKTVSERIEKLNEIIDKSSQEFVHSFFEKKVSFLSEEVCDNKTFGYTPNYIRVCVEKCLESHKNYDIIIYKYKNNIAYAKLLEV